ncbi:MAG: FHA domain-containing protein [Sandaracinaceae bacterium]
MFKLVISDDEGKQTVVPLVRDEITIGRKEGNTIRLTERNVSRRHARVRKANGSFVIEDLHSYNGVKLNGQKIGAETKLEPGDQIGIGDYQLALQVEAADATVPEQVSPAVANADTAMIASPGPPARLVMITPPAPGAEFALTADRVRIGRAEDLDIWVNHRSISREHAEIQKEPDGGLRLIDLGSANGVRVNAQDVQNALLDTGDVVELGQVRFRFVAAGEHYAFDADRTVQMDAVTVEPSSGGNKIPLLVAVAIVILAVIGAVVVAFWGGDDETTVTDLNDVSPEDTLSGQPVDRYQEALDACNDALGANEISRALDQARIALEERPGDEAARACQTQAQAVQSQEETFNRGVRHLEQGELAEAYFQFDSLPETSPLRNRPQVRQAVRSYAGVQLREGQEALADNASEALRLAEFVLNMHGITNEQRGLATQLQRDARDRGGNAEQTEPPEQVATAPTRGGTRRAGRGGGGRGGRGGTSRGGQTESGAGGNGGGGTTSAGGGSQETTPTRGGGGAAANVEDQARQCTMSGDNGCVIRLLEGRARTPNSMAMLIEAYRARGQTNAALNHMRTFVQRFPSHSRAAAYRQILARH